MSRLKKKKKKKKIIYEESRFSPLRPFLHDLSGDFSRLSIKTHKYIGKSTRSS